jgi:hypothetical protein
MLFSSTMNDLIQISLYKGTTLYKAVSALWGDYLITELCHPTIKAAWGV